MGQFKIEITAVGGHGVDREKKEGETVDFFEGGPNTVDASAHSLTLAIRDMGYQIESATITHWPGQESEVKDDLVTGIRKGNF